MINRRQISCLFMVGVILFFSSCSQNKTINQEQTAETLIYNLFTVPNEDVAEVFINFSDDFLADPDWYSNRMVPVVRILCDNLATEEFMNGSGYNSTFFFDVFRLHGYAVIYGYSYTVDSVQLTETGEGQYSYVATIVASYSETTITLSGSIRINQDGLVEYMSLRQAPYEPNL